MWPGQELQFFIFFDGAEDKINYQVVTADGRSEEKSVKDDEGKVLVRVPIENLHGTLDDPSRIVWYPTPQSVAFAGEKKVLFFRLANERVHCEQSVLVN